MQPTILESLHPGYTMPYAFDAIFDHGGTTIIAVNVFDPRVHKDANNNPNPSMSSSI